MAQLHRNAISNIYMMYDRTFLSRAGIGTPLAQVFSIIIDTNATEECEIYGTIKVEDCNGSFYMYDAVKEDSDSFTRHIKLDLSLEKRAICAESGFTMFFDLRDKKRGDVAFISGKFCWKITDAWETLIVANVAGACSSTARVEYAVFDSAIESNIWAEFYREDKNEDSCCSLQLKGKIVASYKYMYGIDDHVSDKEDPDKHYEITLFDDEMSKLDDGDMIPFERALVVLPIGYTLSINVNLTFRDSKGTSTTLMDEVKHIPDSHVDCSYIELKGDFGVLKFGCIGFSYFYPLHRVEGWKKRMRGTGLLLN